MGKFGYKPGDIGWLQLNTGDPNQVIDFYTSLFNWERSEGPEPGYHVFGKGEEKLGAVTGFPEGCDHPAWIPYVTVEDVEAIHAKVTEQGCRILQDMTPLPEDGRYFIFADPGGAPMGVAQYGHNPDC